MIIKTDQSSFDLRKYEFDERAADSACRYVEENVKHVEGDMAGEPFILEEWEKEDIIRPLFGWKHRKTGFRKHRKLYVEVPKKNGKTFLVSAIVTLFMDIEPTKGNCPMYSLATTREQAKSLSFNKVAEIVGQSSLKDRAEIYKNSIIVTNPDSVKFYQPLAKITDAHQGVNPVLAIADETHVYKDADLINNMQKSMISRRNSLMVMITTAGDDMFGVGRQKHDYFAQVAKGILDDESALVAIYAADKDADPGSVETWKQANPNFGVSVFEDALRNEYKEAMFSTASLNSFKRYHLNIWTSTRDGWIEDEIWKENQWNVDLEDLKGQSCWGGLDLSTSSDFSVFSLVFRTKKEMDGKTTDAYISMNWMWVPEQVEFNTAEKYNEHFADWVNDGLIIQTPGNTVDHDFIFEQIMVLAETYDIKKIAFDRFKAEYIIPKLVDEGIKCEPCGQGFVSLLNPTMEIEKHLKDKTFNHLGHPVLRWMANNTEVKSDASGNKKLIKDAKHPEKKIDGVISNIMALKMCIEDQDSESYIEKEGGLSFA